jgi:hypothetical protein
VQVVLEERELTIDRGRRDGTRLLVLVVITARPPRKPFDPDLLKVGRRHFVEGATAQPLSPGLAVALVIPEGALTHPRGGQVFVDYVGNEVVNRLGLTPRARPIHASSLALFPRPTLWTDEGPVEVTVGTCPSDPPVPALALAL